MNGGDKLVCEKRSQPFTRMLLEHKIQCTSHLVLGIGDQAVNKADMVSRYEIINNTINQVIISMLDFGM